ncbi:MAG TPA: hypothetical protein VH025_10915 [Solirubrobacteraceae bacterium]|nr:hypothetical protein [Solirubrobacteraceae bacterium]
MSQPTDPERHGAPAQDGDDGQRHETLPVLAGPQRILASPAEQRHALSRAAAVRPAVQAVAVAAGGFVAGAAVVGLVHRRQQRALSTGRGRRGALGKGRSASAATKAGARGAGELLQVVGTRTLLVDVHLLGGAGGDA